MPVSAKQYVDLNGITVYDEEIKNYIDGLGIGVTYTLSQNPSNPRQIVLTPSEGTPSSATVPEDAIYMTKAQYDAITPATNQLYGLTDWSPEAESIIDDTSTEIDMTWSSSKINTQLSLKANASALPVKTTAVTALTGATSVTITNSAIHTTSLIQAFADNGTTTPMKAPTYTVTEGQCVLGFDALEADTDFQLLIHN